MVARSWAWVFALLLLSGCAAADYSAGVGGFANAVAAQDNAERALIRRADDVRMREWLDQVAKAPASHVAVDLVKCDAPAGYQAGDCHVASDLIGRPPLPTPSSTPSLLAYAKTLRAVATDADCATISGDAASLSASVKTMAATLNAPDLSPLVALANVAACRTIEAYRLDVLRRATVAADPVIQQLVAPIQDKDRRLARLIARDAAAGVDAAAVAYQAAPSRPALKALVDQTVAADTAQQVSLDRSIAAVAALHARLREDLEQRRTDLTHVISDAQAIVDEADTAKAALKTLSARQEGAPPQEGP